MNWLDFVVSFLLVVFMPLPNSAAKGEDPVASSRTVFLSRGLGVLGQLWDLRQPRGLWGDHVQLTISDLNKR